VSEPASSGGAAKAGTGPGTVGIGLPGDTPHRTVAKVAALAEQRGLASFWLNDTPRGDSLEGLLAAAEATRSLRLGSGVIPLDRRASAGIADDIHRLALPQERLVIGLGAGGLEKPLATVREGAAALSASVEASVVIGALGPRMRRLAATASDGVLHNWLTPEIAAATRDEIHREAAGAGRTGRTALYVRTALDRDAAEALREQAAMYDRIPAYARNFDELGVSAIDTAIRPDDPIAGRLGAYRAAVDEVVVRAITADSSEAGYLDFVRRLADLAA
jgi:alkanesulfonate monooxygenase SsuD/methylene tetrahydromethanopterin reductase-like flavin-dependent oxidoreductase (luciferase family)